MTDETTMNNDPPAVLVTGGSRGLGLEIVRKLLSSDWSVVTVQRSVTKELRDCQANHVGRLKNFEFDLLRIEDIEEAFRNQWFSDDRPLAGLVNNAGVAYDDLATNLDIEKLDRMNRLNLVAPMILTKYAIRRMLLGQSSGVQHSGAIVHVSSISAHTGYKGLAMYAATKGGLEAYSRGISREWGSRGIRSNCVVPGFMETEMSQSILPEQRDRIFKRNSLKACTELESVAATVEFLLSNQAVSITGQNYVVDSGTL